MKSIIKKQGQALLELTGTDAINFAEKHGDNTVLVQDQKTKVWKKRNTLDARKALKRSAKAVMLHHTPHGLTIAKALNRSETNPSLPYAEREDLLQLVDSLTDHKATAEADPQERNTIIVATDGTRAVYHHGPCPGWYLEGDEWGVAPERAEVHLIPVPLEYIQAV